MALVVGLLLLVGVAIVVVVIEMGFSCRTQADSGDPHEKHGGAETLNKSRGCSVD
ncbi:hypothetical protein [Synechococcus sp. MU1643]|uniref:hypothetical protein n=1 Tax=Synechococcus sp. MU1643 TaxID=2508349 RepID=UPI001CF8F342|nr:hypothetical protein [Synechococcus sp. MU1643]